MGFRVSGLGFRVSGFGFMVQGSGFGVKVENLGALVGRGQLSEHPCLHPPSERTADASGPLRAVHVSHHKWTTLAQEGVD